jgi:predicted DNA binding CopG/RHH family protein
MAKKKNQSIPKFKTEDQEARFWATHDLTDYFDAEQRANPNFIKLKPSTQSVTIRLPQTMVYALKTIANEQDVPYQSLMKTFLHQKIQDVFSQKKKTSMASSA